MESKDSVSITDVSSAASSDSPGQAIEVRAENSVHSAPTSGSSHRNFYDREVTVRGTDARLISFQVDVEREARIRRNIIVNKGSRQVNTSTGDDE